MMTAVQLVLSARGQLLFVENILNLPFILPSEGAVWEPRRVCAAILINGRSNNCAWRFGRYHDALEERYHADLQSNTPHSMDRCLHVCKISPYS